MVEPIVPLLVEISVIATSSASNCACISANSEGSAPSINLDVKAAVPVRAETNAPSNTPEIVIVSTSEFQPVPI